MGSFCEQYGYNRLNPLSKMRRLKYRQGKPINTKQYHIYKKLTENQLIFIIQTIIKNINQHAQK